MSSELDAYERARAAVVEAQQVLADAFAAHNVRPGSPPIVGEDDPAIEPAVEHADVVEARAALETAHEALRSAEEPLADVLAAAWDANQRAVADARDAAEAAKQRWAEASVEVGNAARARRERPQDVPVLTDEEIARVEAAGEQVAVARAAHVAAQERFKRGVTAEQLVEVA